MLRDSMLSSSSNGRWDGRTRDGRTQDGRRQQDGRTEDNDGDDVTDDGTDGWTEDIDGDDGTGTTGRKERGRTMTTGQVDGQKTTMSTERKRTRYIYLIYIYILIYH